METSAHKEFGKETGASYGNDESGISTTIGNFVNNITGATQSAEINSAEAAKQRNFEKYMSDTQYQRAVKDMKEAGLNPALMYGSGSPAPATSGASASSSGAGAGIVSGVASLFNSASNLLNSNDNTKNKSVRNKIYNTAEKAIKNISKYLN